MMHAIAWKGKSKVEYIEAPTPIITDPRDIILKVTATTICGSDLHLFHNSMPTMENGDILGHEFMGIIQDVGDQVKSLSVGQRVVVAFNIACGDCQFCKREEYTCCEVTNPSKLMEELYGARTSAIYGYSHLTGGVPGGQAEIVRVPFAEFNCLPVPDDLPDDKVLFLSDVVPTSYFGVDAADVKEGDTVAIWGLGPIGLMAARWCQIRKAGRIIGIDCVKQRLEVAKDILNIEVIDFKKQSTTKTLLEWFPTGVDCAIECAGFDYPKSLLHKVEIALNLETDTPEILHEMIYCVRKSGRIAILGVYTGFANHFPIGAMMEKGLTVRGGQSPTQKYWRMCLDKIKSGELDPTFIVTHHAHLSDAPKIYQDFDDKDGVIKAFLRP